MNNLFSVIVPVYNSENYLMNCIDSILSQTYQNIELILVNDGSTDNSLEICKAFAGKDSRVKLFIQENRGQGSARNTGLLNSTGDFVLFVDADDSIEVDTVATHIDILYENPNLDFIQYPIYMDYGTDRQYVVDRPSGFLTKNDDFVKLALKDYSISWIVCDKIFRRSAIEQMKFKENIKFEDNYFMMQLLPQVNSIYLSTKGMYYYYFREGSTTTSGISLLKEMSTMSVLKLQLGLLHEYQNRSLYYKYLVRLVNVRKSLRVNFKKSIADSRFKVSLNELFQAKLHLKDKIKLLFYKITQ